MKDTKLDVMDMSLEEILNLEFDTETTIDYIKDIQELKNLKREIEFNNATKSRVSWKTYFESEEEIINTLKMITTEIKFEDYINGYEYINSFARQVRQGKTLTKKQITQCKRLASQIKLAYVKECFIQLGINYK